MRRACPISGRCEPPSGRGLWKIGRRDFMKASGLVLAGSFEGTLSTSAHGAEPGAGLRFGIVTDAHFADADARGTRYYRESTAKMAECVALMNEQKVDFLVELGDLKDQGNPASEQHTLTYLKAIEEVFAQFNGPRYHVLGNHDIDSLSKEQFLAHVENTGIRREAKYYAFDAGGLHCIVLDANYSADGTDYDHGRFDWTDTHMPPRELAWLRQDLASTSRPVIVFIHQTLDDQGDHTVRNAAQVRHILHEHGRVLAVFQGHNHAGHYRQIDRIHYYTLGAMVEGSGAENSSFAIVEVDPNCHVAVNGYRKAVSMDMARA